MIYVMSDIHSNRNRLMKLLASIENDAIDDNAISSSTSQQVANDEKSEQNDNDNENDKQETSDTHDTRVENDTRDVSDTKRNDSDVNDDNNNETSAAIDNNANDANDESEETISEANAKPSYSDSALQKIKNLRDKMNVLGVTSSVATSLLVAEFKKKHNKGNSNKNDDNDASKETAIDTDIQNQKVHNEPIRRANRSLKSSDVLPMLKQTELSDEFIKEYSIECNNICSDDLIIILGDLFDIPESRIYSEYEIASALDYALKIEENIDDTKNSSEATYQNAFEATKDYKNKSTRIGNAVKILEKHCLNAKYGIVDKDGNINNVNNKVVTKLFNAQLKSEEILAAIESLPCNVICIRGNHDSASEIYRLGGTPTTIYGGNTTQIGNNLFFLEDGETYELPFSSDDPQDTFEVIALGGGYGHLDRFKSITLRGYEKIANYKKKYQHIIYRNNEDKIDVKYVLSHDVPSKHMGILGILFGKSKMNLLLDLVDENIEYDKWIYGHHHCDYSTQNNKYECIYNKVLTIEKEKQ